MLCPALSQISYLQLGFIRESSLTLSLTTSSSFAPASAITGADAACERGNRSECGV